MLICAYVSLGTRVRLIHFKRVRIVESIDAATMIQLFYSVPLPPLVYLQLAGTVNADAGGFRKERDRTSSRVTGGAPFELAVTLST